MHRLVDAAFVAGPEVLLPERAVPVQAFQRQAELHPERVALRFEGREVSYAELAGMAGAVARSIRESAPRPSLVALCLPRSPELVAAALGAQLAGAAYVPLDTTGPSARLVTMLERGGIELVLTTRELAHHFTHARTPLLLLEGVSWHDVTTDLPELDDQSAAYVIHTSGSTGHPKGVVVSHRALYNRLDWMQRAYPIGASDRVLHKTPYTFDVSVWELLWPLMYGATLDILPPGLHRDAERLLSHIEREHITVLHFVPSMLRIFLELSSPSCCSDVRLVFSSGEALDYPAVDRFRDLWPTARLINLYGPTEAAIDATHWDCASARASATPPIGRPIQNTSCFLLGAERQLLRVGEVGELCIAGAGLADGYLRDPDRTSAAFVSWSVPGCPEQRFYRTGDQARLLPSGDFEFLGRNDDQVKVRGQRVELQEVSQALAQLPDVLAACALFEGGKIIGCVQLRAKDDGAPRRLKAELSRVLPEAALPQQVFVVAEMPLNPNGKVDKASLRALLATPPSDPADSPEARDPLLEQLRGIWAAALELPLARIDARQTFFELGGDSLSLLRALARCKREKLPISLKDLHDARDLHALTAQARGRLGAALGTEAQTAPRAFSSNFGPEVTPLQGELFEYCRSLGSRSAYVVQQVVELRGASVPARVESTCRELLRRHELLRSRFVRQGGEIVRVDAGEASLVLQLRDQREATLSARRREDAELRERERELGFDLDRDTCVRFTALWTADDRVSLLVTAHHLVLDGASLSLLRRELRELWRASEAPGASSALPASVTFSSFARWLASQDRAAARTFWRDSLTEAAPTHFEPETKADAQTVRAECSFRVSDVSAAALRAHGISVSTACNYLFGAVLSRYHGKLDVTWGNTLSLRESSVPDAARIVGPCIGTVPMTATFGTDATLSSAMRDLQLRVLTSLEHAHLGPGDIASVARHGSLFDALFTFQSQATDEEPDDERAAVSAHFGLTLSMVQSGSELGAYLSCSTACLSEAQAADFLAALQRTWQRLPDLLARPVRDLDVLAPSHPSQPILGALLQGPTYRQPAFDLLAALSRSLREHAECTAVVDGDGEQHTFSELDDLSARIASRLQAHGVVAPVGIAVPRSFALVAAVLGTLRAGAACVSLDPTFPLERLRWIARELGVDTVLGDADGERIAVLVGARHLRVDGQLPEPTVGWDSDARELEIERLCAVHHTSGSSGAPKLVLTDIASHACRLSWLLDTFPATKDDVYCFKTRLSFAPALREILEPLLQGRPLVVVPEQALASAPAFVELVRSRAVTRLFLTPSFLSLLLDGGYAGALSGLRYLELSGEPLSIELAERARKALPQATLLNRYGATEAASLVYARLEAGTHAGRCPAGSPIHGTGVSVVDSFGRLVPRGRLGQVRLAGPGVACGYSRTDSKPAAFGHDDQQRTFATGDVGFVGHDQQLYIAARASRMLKRAGHRIEPREIEAALEARAEVSRAVVLGLAAGADTRIVAVLTLCCPVELEELRSHLRAQLPAYLLPSELIVRDEIPLTVSGKVDYVALEQQLSGRESVTPSPDTAVERRLLALLEPLCRPLPVSLDDELLGSVDSLSALRIAHALEREFGLDLRISDLNQCGSLRALARHIEGARSAAATPLTLNSGRGRHVVFAFPPAGSDAHVYLPWNGELDPSIELRAFPSRPQSSPSLKLEDEAERYADLIEQSGCAPPISLLGWSLGGTLAYAVGACLERRGRRPERLLLIDPGFNTSGYDDALAERGFSEALAGKLDQGLDPCVAAALRARLIEDTHLIRDYVPAPYSGAITLIKPAQIAPDERNWGKPLNGLERCARGDLELRVSAGDHLTMMGTHAAEVCAIVNHELTGAT